MLVNCIIQLIVQGRTEPWTERPGPYLHLFLRHRRKKSGAFVQFQTFCSSTSTSLQIQTNKKYHQRFGLNVDGPALGGIGKGLVIIERKSSFLKFYPIQIFRRYTVSNLIPHLLLQKRRSGAFVQIQTCCSSTSTSLKIQTNKKYHQLFGLCADGLLLWRRSG